MFSNVLYIDVSDGFMFSNVVVPFIFDISFVPISFVFIILHMFSFTLFDVGYCK